MSMLKRDLDNLQNTNPIKLDGFDYVEFYVGNALQAAHFYRTAFGFIPKAYAGLETGVRDQMSIVVEQNKIRLVLSSPIVPESPVADHVRLHGDGVKDIAFTVEDVNLAFEETVRRGAHPVMEPRILEDKNGYVVKATISAYGDTVHSFIERKTYEGSFLPGYEPIKNVRPVTSAGLDEIDHIAISVKQGSLSEWVAFYSDTMGFRQSHQEDVSTEYSAMNSKVIEDSTGRIKFPIVEPAPGRRKSQIDEYLTYYNGPGAQHIALLSHNIFGTVRDLQSNGIEFLSTPRTYYELLESRLGNIEENMEALRELGILVDRDRWGYLLQVFSKSLQSRPTVFWEVIQRKGGRGFGGGNVRALFEAVEREQSLRGNL